MRVHTVSITSTHKRAEAIHPSASANRGQFIIIARNPPRGYGHDLTDVDDEDCTHRTTKASPLATEWTPITKGKVEVRSDEQRMS